jgi:hypothetical protein
MGANALQDPEDEDSVLLQNSGIQPVRTQGATTRQATSEHNCMKT